MQIIQNPATVDVHGLYDLLQARGVTDVNEFLEPTAASLNDFQLFDNIPRGIRMLHTVLSTPDSRILIVVDCDVDGFTSGAVMYRYITQLHPEQQLDYVLHEHKQHGLEDHIEWLQTEAPHYDLIILPDSSSNDFIYHEELRLMGTQCLVLDHHEVDFGQKMSDNACIINNQLSELYPNKELTGAGVTWQFCRAYDDWLSSEEIKVDVASKLIDLAALGICGDMGSILNLENRYIMYAGFKTIRNYFFQKAIEKQSYSMGGDITPISVAFYIVPMINALVRIGSMEEKNRLFMALIDGHQRVPCNKRGAKGTTEEVAVESLRECTNAKSRQNRIADEMMERADIKIHKYDLLRNKILFVRLDDDDDYPPEIVGLCAMKLAAKYKKPTIITRLNEDGIDKGSIRNVADCALTDFKAFLNNSGYFEWVQGHANAAGCAIEDSRLYGFHEYANEALADIDFGEGVYKVDFIMGPNDELQSLIYNLAGITNIWGQGNPEPLIYVHDLMPQDDEIAVIGANKDTLRITKNDVVYIQFHATETIEQLRNCNCPRINIVGKPNLNNWGGRVTEQLIIESCEIIDDLLEF